jgi:hypothetical protein
MHSRYKRRRKVGSMVSQKEADTKEVPEVDIGTVMDVDMEEGEVDPQHVLFSLILVMSHDVVPRCACSVHIVISMSMSLKIVPNS